MHKSTNNSIAAATASVSIKIRWETSFRSAPTRMDSRECTGVLHSISETQYGHRSSHGLHFYLSFYIRRLLGGWFFFVHSVLRETSTEHAYNHKRFMCTRAIIKSCRFFFSIHTNRQRKRVAQRARSCTDRITANVILDPILLLFTLLIFFHTHSLFHLSLSLAPFRFLHE